MANKKIGDLIYGAVLNTKNFVKGSKELVTATKKTNDKIQKTAQGVGKLNKNLDKAGKKAGFMSKQIIKLRTTLLAAAGTTAFIKFLNSAAKEALRFEKEMIRINTVTQLSKEGLDQLADGLVNLSKKLAVPLKDLQAGLFDVASAGIEAAQQLNFLTAASAFAAVGQFKVATAVQGLTAILKGYGAGLADTERVMNLFLQTNVKGQTTLEDLSVAVQGIAGVANNAGVTMEEFFAILATGTGVTGNAKEVATQLKGAINALNSPTAEASAKFKEMGIEVGTAAIKEKGLVAVMKEVFDAVNGDAEALRKLIPEIEATTLIIALATTQNEKFNENLRESQGELNLTTKQYAEFANSVSGKLIIVGNEWTRFKTVVGNAIISIISLLIDLKNEVSFNLSRSLDKAGSAIDNFLGGVTQFVGATQNFLGFKEAAKETFAVTDELFRNSLKLFNKSGEVYDKQAEKTKVLKKALKDLASAQQTFGSTTGATDKKVSDFAGGSGGLKKSIDTTKEAEKAISELGKEYDKWQNGIEKTEKKLEDLGEKNEKIMNDIREAISGVTEEIGQLEGAFAEDIAKEVIGAEKKLSDLRSELQEADLGEGRIAFLKEEIKLQENLIATGQQLIDEGILNEEDLVEARRKASLNSIQAKAEEFKAEKAVLEERTELLRQLEEGEEIVLEEIKDAKNRILIEELQARQTQVNAEIMLVEQQQLAIQNAWIEGAQAIEAINDELIARLDAKYQALANRIRSALAAASGGREGGGQNGGQFQSGGFTGEGQSNAPAGVVHAGEWVANARFVRDNKHLIRALDYQQRKGFQSGGNVENSHNRTVTINPTVKNSVGLRALMREARYHLR